MLWGIAAVRIPLHPSFRAEGAAHSARCEEKIPACGSILTTQRTRRSRCKNPLIGRHRAQSPPPCDCPIPPVLRPLKTRVKGGKESLPLACSQAKALPLQGANACVMRSTTVWCARTHELAILHMQAKLLTARRAAAHERSRSNARSTCVRRCQACEAGGLLCLSATNFDNPSVTACAAPPSWRRQGRAPPSGTKSPLIWRFLSSRIRRSPAGAVCITYALTLAQGRLIRVIMPLRQRMRLPTVRNDG